MIGFKVIEDDGGDFVVVGNRLQTAKEGLGEIELDGVDDRHTVAATHRIGVVAGAVGSAQDDVEAAQVGIEGADPVHPGGDGHRSLKVGSGTHRPASSKRQG
jgi:hypothetical protein